MTDPDGPWRRHDPPRHPDSSQTSGGDPPPAEAAAQARPNHVPTFPPIPTRAGSADEDGTNRRSSPRIGLITLVAALLGGVVAATATVAALDRREVEPTATVREQPTQAPEIAVVQGRTQVEAVAEAVLPTVVQIDIGGQSAVVPTAAGNGSGVVYRTDGYIITNNHVVESADDMEVVLADGSREQARLIGRDVLSDIAVIKVDREDLTAIRVGDSSQLRVGQLAVAIGSPFGLEGSVTAGVISALNRPISVGQGIRLPNVIQTDAPINPGNSGGALVGADGRLIGINSAILTTGAQANAGVGFAVPVATAVDIADELIDSGSVVYPFLGVEGGNVPSTAAERLGVDQGALVTAVQNNTPAADAGLRVDDVVIEFDGNEITSMDDLIVAVRQGEVGDTVEVVYIRDGDERTVEVTLVERPEL
ncbi:MAG: PDZ domain-containing protein [Nitriliruptorales bacterium]|nr:PDZ domain-containing protein [Nitriliruptorales bacterium]